MKERFIIIIVAIISGLFITSAGFFIYQTTKKANDQPIAQNNVSPPPAEEIPNDGSVFIRVLDPRDETLINKRTLIVKGSTNADNVVVVSTNLEDVEVKPTTEGEFSVSVDIDAGANTIITRAVAPDGTSAQDIRTITYSTEEF